MNAADTSDSIATADWTPLTVVSRSRTPAEIETFMNDVSMTKTNIAAARKMPSRGSAAVCSSELMPENLPRGRRVSCPEVRRVPPTLGIPGRLAQLVERLPYKQEVACSSHAPPIASPCG